MKHFLLASFSRLKPSVLLVGFLMFLLPQLSWGQTTIHSNDCSAATTNWTFTNGGGVAVQQGGYWLVDNIGDQIISQSFDVSTYTNLSLNFKVATYGSNTNNPCKVEYSTDGGTSWSATTFTSATPTSSSPYIASGTWSLGTVNSTQFKLRWTWGGTSGKGVRIDDIALTGTSAVPTITLNTAG